MDDNLISYIAVNHENIRLRIKETRESTPASLFAEITGVIGTVQGMNESEARALAFLATSYSRRTRGDWQADRWAQTIGVPQIGRQLVEVVAKHYPRER